MRIVMGDLLEAELRSLPKNLTNGRILLHSGLRVYPCIGCMDCLGRRPGHCSIKDALAGELEVLGIFDELELVSACCYGGLSPKVKAGLDRFFAYLRPAMEVRKKETRFLVQAVGKFGLVLRLYGPRSEEERKTALAYAELLGKTLNAERVETHFYRTREDLLAGKEILGVIPEKAEYVAFEEERGQEPADAAFAKYEEGGDP